MSIGLMDFSRRLQARMEEEIPGERTAGWRSEFLTREGLASRPLRRPELSDNRLQDTAILVVIEFDGRIDAQRGLELLDGAVGTMGFDRQFRARLQSII